MFTATKIRTTLLLPTAALLALTGVTLAASTGAMAQSAANSSVATLSVASVAGRWLHDPQGSIIGSVRGLADGGQTAVLMIGSYFRPGSHEVRVPASQLSVADGQVTLRPEISEAMNVMPQR